MWCGVVWCGAVWCGFVISVWRCGVVWCGVQSFQPLFRQTHNTLKHLREVEIADAQHTSAPNGFLHAIDNFLCILMYRDIDAGQPPLPPLPFLPFLSAPLNCSVLLYAVLCYAMRLL